MAASKKPLRFIALLLLIEFLDELVFGVREAAWPLIRDDLGLNYVQIGLVLSIPGLVSSAVEPFLGILGDTWQRGRLVLGGGVAFSLALLAIAGSDRFAVLLGAFILFYPASGAFVSLSQATLMDLEPKRHENNMAAWVFAGSLGVALGPLALSAAVWLGLGWRQLFLAMSVLAVVLVAAARRENFRPSSGRADPEREAAAGFRAGLKDALYALRQKSVLRWLILLEFSDLMLDTLLGFLALYMVDVAGGTPLQAGLAVGVWSLVGLAGDFLQIPLLERMRGVDYLRISVVIELVLFPLFLLIPDFTAKIVLLGLLGFFNAGWYSILKGRLYSAMPGKSGTAVALSNISGMFSSVIPLGVGLLASTAGLGAAMWILLAGPLALLAGLFGKIDD